MSPFVFYPLALLTVAAALGVVLTNNPVRSALSLVATLFLLAVYYVALQAHLVAALQIIVYAGAVMVLFLFVITLLNLMPDPADRGHPLMTTAAMIAGLLLAVVLGRALWATTLPGSEGVVIAQDFGTTVVLARQLFSEYLVAFELTSVLLLVAVVGAVVLAKHDPADEAVAPGQDLEAGEQP